MLFQANIDERYPSDKLLSLYDIRKRGVSQRDLNVIRPNLVIVLRVRGVQQIPLQFIRLHGCRQGEMGAMMTSIPDPAHFLKANSYPLALGGKNCESKSLDLTF